MNAWEKVAKIVADAGGRIVGRTRLQKVTYLLTVTGLEGEFRFSYKHYGPYSELLESTARLENLFGSLTESEHTATWGGSYYVFDSKIRSSLAESDARRVLARTAADADAIVLELAATSIFLFKEGFEHPWEETARRKPEKASEGRIKDAKALINSLRRVSTPVPLPDF